MIIMLIETYTLRIRFPFQLKKEAHFFVWQKAQK